VVQLEPTQDCVETILQKGEVQVSSAERKEKLEKRKREVINFIHKYYVDPSKKLPHPVARIENALEECKVRVDADVPVEKQIPDIISKLVNVIPLKKTTLEGQLIVPHSFIGAASSIIARYVTVERESYSSHGCTYDIGIVPGEYDLFMSEMNRVTKGNFDFHVDSQKGAAATTTTSSSTDKTKLNNTLTPKKVNKQK
jgi:ribosome maturation protein SDO1